MKTYLKILGLVLLFVSCDKDEIIVKVELDKQINFELSLHTNHFIGGSYYGYGDTIWSNPYNHYGSCLKNFNKTNYVDIETIVISVPMWSTSENIICYVDLFNLTDSIPIEDSQIESNSLAVVYITSSNLLDKLPDKTIDLALRIKSSVYSTTHSYNVGVGLNSYLFLNR